VPWAACTVSCGRHCRVFSEGSRSLGTMRRQRPMQVWVRVQTTQSKLSQTMSVASGLDRLENQTLLLRATSASRRRTTALGGFLASSDHRERQNSIVGHSARPLGCRRIPSNRQLRGNIFPKGKLAARRFSLRCRPRPTATSTSNRSAIGCWGAGSIYCARRPEIVAISPSG
jgi:hypothetical protein